jgi:hypothetical protein
MSSIIRFPFCVEIISIAALNPACSLTVIISRLDAFSSRSVVLANQFYDLNWVVFNQVLQMQNIFLILGFAKAFGSIFPVKAKPLAPVSISFNKERLLDKPICTS